MKRKVKKMTAVMVMVVMSVLYIGIPAIYVGAYTHILPEEEFVIEEINENSLYAKSAVLMDADSGRVLYGKNVEEQMAMASTTKIMTLLIALEEGNLEEVTTVSKYAASMPDVQLNMKEGEQYKLKDLLYSLMLESHNDSAVAIAECIAGSVEGFANRMNKKAKEIGCQNTCFITPNGLDATAILTDENGNQKEVFHSTTAEDLAKIMSYCITKSSCKDEFLEITQTPTYTFSNCAGTRTFTCRNHNSFLYMMEGAISGKTGFTGKAGYCYVGALERDGRTFTVALLACGWPNNKSYKWKDTKRLMEYGIENYRYASFEDAIKDVPVSGSIPVENGQTKRIGDVAYAEWKMEEENEDMPKGILLRKDEKIEVTWDVEEQLAAPVFAGKDVGGVCCKVNEEKYWEKDMLVTSEVKEIDFDWCINRILRKFCLF